MTPNTPGLPVPHCVCGGRGRCPRCVQDPIERVRQRLNITRKLDECSVADCEAMQALLNVVASRVPAPAPPPAAGGGVRLKWLVDEKPDANGMVALGVENVGPITYLRDAPLARDLARELNQPEAYLATRRAPAGPDPVPPTMKAEVMPSEPDGSLQQLLSVHSVHDHSPSWPVTPEGRDSVNNADPVPEGRANDLRSRRVKDLIAAAYRQGLKSRELRTLYALVSHMETAGQGTLSHPVDPNADKVSDMQHAGQGTQAGGDHGVATDRGVQDHSPGGAPSESDNTFGRNVGASPALPPSMEEVERLVRAYAKAWYLHVTEWESSAEESDAALAALLSAIQRLAAPQGAGEWSDEECEDISQSDDVMVALANLVIQRTRRGIPAHELLAADIGAVRAILRAAQGREK